jgi:hypothetical protein
MFEETGFYFSPSSAYFNIKYDFKFDCNDKVNSFEKDAYELVFNIGS